MSPVATLVERSARYLMLAGLPDGHRAELVADALAAAITTLPRQLTRTVNRVFAARCRKADVRPITVHDARRTCGSLLAGLDVHPRVAMEILRHADFAVTMEIYTQVSSKQTREALKRLGQSLS
jgi:integrase